MLTYHHQPVDLELVEGLGQTEVVEGEEEGPEETDHHHRQEPVLAVRVGRGAADDAEKCQDLEIFRNIQKYSDCSEYLCCFDSLTSRKIFAESYQTNSAFTRDNNQSENLCQDGKKNI